jgi:hypothetical protein
MSFDEFTLQLTIERGGDAYRMKVFAACANHSDFFRLSDGSTMHANRAEVGEALVGGGLFDERVALTLANQLAVEAVMSLMLRHAEGLTKLRKAAAERELAIAAEKAAAEKQNSYLL